ncbi:MAG: OmpA family protein [Chromatiaceae bacterium]|nr:OmpA family protein [Gammaproteobacteria bacterium]MCP5305835.1 OmpA family protein [Chromatiaceae bacterium]MCP5312691.1 OmpA family protein [Chromatiaceae bacterium]
MSRSTAILVGVGSLLLLTWITVAMRHTAIEADLTARVERELAGYAIDGLQIEAVGRDLRLIGEIPRAVTADYVADLAGEVWGVRVVDAQGLKPRASLLDADDPLNPRFEPSRIIRLGGDLTNPMDAGACQRTMARLAASSSVRFETNAASPMIESYPLLNDLAAVAYQCPATRIVIGGHTDASGDRDFNLRLSQARAEAVERFFYLAGIPAERMRIVAWGDSQPIASNATPEGRAANRRITFDVLPTE